MLRLRTLAAEPRPAGLEVGRCMQTVCVRRTRSASAKHKQCVIQESSGRVMRDDSVRQTSGWPQQNLCAAYVLWAVQAIGCARLTVMGALHRTGMRGTQQRIRCAERSGEAATRRRLMHNDCAVQA